MIKPNFDCPLCKGIKIETFFYQKHLSRCFYLCLNCDLIFVDRKKCLKLSDQKAHYDTHENHLLTEGYEKFLMRLVNFVRQNKDLKAAGLDYGSGPYPMLKKLFHQHKFSLVDIYDPIYAPKELDQKKVYDFITLCEVAEHFINPRQEFKKLFSLLAPKGVLVVSTKLHDENIDFNKWHYIVDPTHVSFYSKKTVDYLRRYFDFESKEVLGDLFILWKK